MEKCSDSRWEARTAPSPQLPQRRTAVVRKLGPRELAIAYSLGTRQGTAVADCSAIARELLCMERPPLSPYLAGVPSLPKELRKELLKRRLDRQQAARARAIVAKLAKLIRRQRTLHEMQSGNLVVPEAPTPPHRAQ